MNTPKFSFGASTTPATTAGTTTTGGLFGSSATTSTPATGLFGFGKPGTTTTTGQPTTGTTSLTGSTSFSSGFSGFGAKPATTASTTFSSPFGQATPATQSSPFSFNKPATTTAATSSPFSFGSTTTAAAPATTTTTGGFGGFSGFGATPAATTTGTPGLSTSLFGTATQQQQQQQQPTSSFFSTTQPTLQQQQPQQQQQQQQPTSLQDADQLMSALVNPQVFNDERDQILAKWNQLQAFYGTGKIFYQNASIDVTKDNRLTKFKTVGYSCNPMHKNENGLVCLVLNQKEATVKANQKNITDTLHKIFNSDQSLNVCIDSIKPTSDDRTEVVFYVEQRVSPLNVQKNRVPGLLVFNHLNKQEPPGSIMSGLKTSLSIKQQLEQMNVANMYPLIGLNEEQVKKYLDTPPAGINPVFWEQAKKNNPNAKKLIPVVICGFQEINKRFKLQDQENNAQKLGLTLINDKIEELNSKNQLIKSKIEQFKARNEELEQRVLKVTINYEIRRKIGLPLQDNEKYLLGLLETFQIELNSPINKEIQRQKLSEFNEILKTYESVGSRGYLGGGGGGGVSGTTPLIDANSLTDIQKSLREQHKAFKSLIEIINKDMKDVALIKQDLLYQK